MTLNFSRKTANDQCVNHWPECKSLSLNSHLFHWSTKFKKRKWLWNDTKQPGIHLFPLKNSCHFSNKCKSKWLSPWTKRCYQRMETKQTPKGTQGKLLFAVPGHEKKQQQQHISWNRMIALEDQYCRRWKTCTCFITCTRLARRSSFTVQVDIKHSSTRLLFIPQDSLPLNIFLPSVYSLFPSAAEMKTEVNPPWFNCSLFMLSSRVNKDPSSVNWILQLAVTERAGVWVYRWDNTQSHSCSQHVFLPFKPNIPHLSVKNNPKQEVNLVYKRWKGLLFSLSSTAWP